MAAHTSRFAHFVIRTLANLHSHPRAGIEEQVKTQSHVHDDK